jgi:hypothetical protein
MEQWDSPPPDCPACAERQMQQEFKPVAIGGSISARANAAAEDIAANDYHVADMTREREGIPKVRYKDQIAASVPPSTWGGVPHATLEAAIASGRQMRLQFGSGLDVLQSNIRNGIEPDLIANSKRISTKVW